MSVYYLFIATQSGDISFILSSPGFQGSHTSEVLTLHGIGVSRLHLAFITRSTLC